MWGVENGPSSLFWPAATVQAVIWNGTMFGDLDWPINTSRRFVSIAQVCQHQLSFLYFTRMLATTNRSRVSIRLAKKLARAGGLVDPVQIFFSSSLITMQNFVTISHIVCAHVSLLGRRGPALCLEAWQTHRNTPLHICYYAEFSRSRSKAIIIQTICFAIVKTWFWFSFIEVKRQVSPFTFLIRVRHYSLCIPSALFKLLPWFQCQSWF